jgi:hypothetical protein
VVVLADRMGCLKGGVVANIVVPTAGYVRFATHCGFRPDFCEAADPESKGAVQALVRYAKSDLVVPADDFAGDLTAANAVAVAWCTEVDGSPARGFVSVDRHLPDAYATRLTGVLIPIRVTVNGLPVIDLSK